MTPPLADKASGLARVPTRPALGGELFRETSPSTWGEVVAVKQPGRCPEACLRKALQLAPRPRVAGWQDWHPNWEASWEEGWKASWEGGWAADGWEVSWEVAGEVAQGVFLALQLLAKARATRAQHPPLRELQLLAPPPLVLQLLPLLAPPPRVLQALRLAAKVPVGQEASQQLCPPQAPQRLQPPPRIVVHGGAGEGGHTYWLGVWQCRAPLRKRANAS